MAFLKNISSTNQSDTELVLAYRQSGDLKVLGDLYQRYMELVYGVCLKYLKDSELAQDAVMQIFEELVSKLKKHEVENFRGWLHQVAKNYCLMQLRNKGTKTAKELNEHHAVTFESDKQELIANEKTYNLLEEVLQELGEEQRQCVILFYLKKNSYQQISEKTGYSLMQVKSYIQNGKRNLKILLDKKMNQRSEGK